MKLSVAEFRKNMREAFNAAESGETVFITRHDKWFKLISFEGEYKLAADPEKVNHLKKIEPVATQHTPNDGEPFAKNIEVDTSGHIRPRVSSLTSEFSTAVEAGKSIPKCCTLTKPCKHWNWDEVNQWYFNYLTGEKREVEQ